MIFSVMSVFHAIQLTRPEEVGFLSTSSIQFDVPYVSLATALSILIAVILVPRLLELRRQISLTVTSNEKKNFTSIESLIVESSFPNGVISIVFIVLYGVSQVTSVLLIPLIVQLMVSCIITLCV